MRTASATSSRGIGGTRRARDRVEHVARERAHARDRRILARRRPRRQRPREERRRLERARRRGPRAARDDEPVAPARRERLRGKQQERVAGRARSHRIAARLEPEGHARARSSASRASGRRAPPTRAGRAIPRACCGSEARSGASDSSIVRCAIGLKPSRPWAPATKAETSDCEGSRKPESSIARRSLVSPSLPARSQKSSGKGAVPRRSRRS